MNHPRRVWIAFALSLAVVLAAMGWVSHTALRLDRQRQQARQLAEREELVRLALWRMDAAMTTVVAQEIARPYYQYQPFHSLSDAYTSGLRRVGGGGVLVPSPLLRPDSALVRLYFHVDPGGQVGSPQVPIGAMRKLAAPQYVPEKTLQHAEAMLEKLQAFLSPNRKELLAGLPAVPQAPAADAQRLLVASNALRRSRDQKTRNEDEFNVRAMLNLQGQFQQTKAVSQRYRDVRDGEARSIWLGRELVLARRVAVAGSTHVVGCWLDWAKTQQWLLSNVRDLLPSSRLEAVPAGAGPDASRRLAALPVRLVSGPVALEPAAQASGVLVSLAAAWAGLLLAAGAVAGLLAGTLALSERRAAFVSAVTHELRTPLTTLSMYTEMLADGMVADERKASQYLDTLHSETNRLCRLVENVLSYSRLERNRLAVQKQPVELAGLLDRVAPRLRRRAEEAGMELVLDPAGAAEARVLADPTALEQILFNLLDNACKYAASSADKRIHVECRAGERTTALRVRDHGPGIPAADLPKVFRPFFRAQRDSAGSLGGVGLGLSISRRLARSLGGDLTLETGADQGASFNIVLPNA